MVKSNATRNFLIFYVLFEFLSPQEILNFCLKLNFLSILKIQLFIHKNKKYFFFAQFLSKTKKIKNFHFTNLKFSFNFRLFSLPFLLLTDQLFTVEWQALYYSNRFYIANWNDALPKRMSMPMLHDAKSFFSSESFLFLWMNGTKKKLNECWSFTW